MTFQTTPPHKKLQVQATPNLLFLRITPYPTMSHSQVTTELLRLASINFKLLVLLKAPFYLYYQTIILAIIYFKYKHLYNQNLIIILFWCPPKALTQVEGLVWIIFWFMEDSSLLPPEIIVSFIPTLLNSRKFHIWYQNHHRKPKFCGVWSLLMKFLLFSVQCTMSRI